MREEIKELLVRQPFEAFRIIVTSGERYAVGDPLTVALGQSMLGLFPPKTDRWHLIRLNQIAALEAAERAA